jgi:hypothetical protein
MATVAFHVTSTHNRASIFRHGLDWTRMGIVPGGEADGFLFTTERVPPDRVRLLRTDA